MSDAATARRGRFAVWPAVALGLTIMMGFAVYSPQRPRPFHVIDFSEFLPLLNRSHGARDALDALLRYYGSQGRFNAIPYALLAVKWTWFGDSSLGWQLSRAATMLALIGLTYGLLRRLGASRLGGALGASVYLFAPAAAVGWMRLTMAEPLPTVFLLAACIRATTFQRRTRWVPDVILFAVVAAVTILFKELMAPAVVLPVGLALCIGADGTFALPRFSRRNVVLVTVVGIAMVTALIPVAVVYFSAPKTAYASSYGSSWRSPGEILAIWIVNLLPFNATTGPSIPWALALIGFIVLLASGWRVGFQSPSGRRNAKWLLAMALFTPLIGLAAYVPLGWYQLFYAIPYLIGAALLVGMAATYLQMGVRNGGVLAILTWTFVAIYALGDTGSLVAATDATQRSNAALSAFVADSARADTVLFATDYHPEAFHEWFGPGPTLQRYADATGHPWPPTHDITCAEARGGAPSSARMTMIVYASECPILLRRATQLVVHYRRLDWQRWRVVHDSVLAQVLRPAIPAGDRFD